MGGNNSHDFDQDKFNNLWQRKQNNFNGRSIWKNRSNPLRQIQQYPIYANTQHDIQRQGQLFDLRRGSDQLVAATHLKQTKKGGLCSSAAQGRLFLQRIPLKLDALQHIPFPDILHLHFNCLTGYKKLFKVTGPFRPQQQQIGFNLQGEAKVWLNRDYSAAQPAIKQTSQATMVKNILQIIQENIDTTTTPRQNPSIINYIYRNKSQATFDQALIAVRQYANRFNNGNIPKRLQCIQKVGIDTISKSLVQIKEQIPSGFSNNQRNTLNNVLYQPPLPYSQPTQTFTSPQLTQNRGTFVSNNSAPLKTFVGTNYPNTQSNRVLAPYKNSFVQNRVSQVRSSNINFNFGGSRVQNAVQQPPIINQAPLINQQNVSLQRSPVFIQPVVQQNNQIQVSRSIVQGPIQTIRPAQQVVSVRPPQQQRVIQQIVRQPLNQQAVEESFVNQGVLIHRNVPLFNGVPIFSTINQGGTQNQLVRAPVQNLIPDNRVEINNKVQETRGQNISNPNKISQQVFQVNTLSNQTNENQFSHQSHSRNVIQANTSAVQIGNASTNIEKLWGGNNTFQSKNYNSFDSKNGGLQFNAASSRYKDVNLEDGKSSQALLAQLRELSSNKLDSATNINTYKYQYSNHYNFDSFNLSSAYNTEKTGQYNVTSNEKGSYDNDIYNTFSKYAKDNNNLEDNLQMKYSMTQQLYDNHQPNNYNYISYHHEQHYENQPEQYQYQQEGQYHVDYDPQILADIQRMNK